jgi:putative transposase/transposase-like zinc-binding protein
VWDLGTLCGRYADRVGPLTAAQRRAAADLAACRTAALGGRLEQCSCCGRQEYRYHSCRNRHCPKCQGHRRAAWLEREAGFLLPVEYHHLVFTLPHELAPLALTDPRPVYGLLFAAASACVQELAADPKYLGAQVGLTAVLHTWGQTLGLHPHLHVLATGGGLSCNRKGEVDAAPRWVAARAGFFLPVRVVSALFRGKFLAGLRQAHEQGRLRLPQALAEPGALAALVAGLSGRDWVVYSQPPCAGAEVVLKYLARYVHRVALSPGRLLRAEEEGVTFTYKDYRQRGRPREMTLRPEEFVRRFLQHVLPSGFVRIRHYGLLANRGREAKLRRCRRLLLAEAVARPAAAGERPPRQCGVCGEGVMVVVGLLPRAGQTRPAPAAADTS